MDENKITIINEDGSEEECDILFTFKMEQTGKDYVVFMTKDEDISAAIYDSSDEGDGVLYPVESDEEWDIIEEALEQYAEEMEDDEEDEE